MLCVGMSRQQYQRKNKSLSKALNSLTKKRQTPQKKTQRKAFQMILGKAYERMKNEY